MKSLESRLYVATDADIEEIALGYLRGVQALGAYHKAQIATIQVELLGKPRVRSAEASKLTEDEIKMHMQALQTVSKKFAAAAAKALKARGLNAKEVNKRTNFIRSAKRELKAFIWAGGDVRSLVAARTTKASIRAQTAALLGTLKPAGENTFERTILRSASQIEASARELAAIDKDQALSKQALSNLDNFLARIVAVRSELGGRPVKDAEQAVREGRPLKLAAGMFMPMRTRIKPSAHASA